MKIRFVPTDTTYLGQLYERGNREVPDELADFVDERYGKPEEGEEVAEAKTLAEQVKELQKQLEESKAKIAQLETDGKTDDKTPSFVQSQDNTHPIGSAEWFKHELKANGQTIQGNPSLETLKKRYDDLKGV